MTFTAVAAFLGVALLAYVTPGPDWFVVARHAGTRRRSGYIAALGVQSGLVIHMTAAALGVAAVLLASAEAFTALKLIGAAYLIYLGVQSLVRVMRHRDGPAAELSADSPTPLGTVYRQSMLANVLNPKAALFFVAVLPQFLDASSTLAPQVLLLGTLDILLGIAWWFLFVNGISRVKKVLGRTRSSVVLDGVSGVALLGLGGTLAFASPPRA